MIFDIKFDVENSTPILDSFANPISIISLFFLQFRVQYLRCQPVVYFSLIQLSYLT